MAMTITRRDLLAWGGGLTAGLLVTPLPWKVVDDSAKWTQNWPWIPQPARGPVETRASFCTLCPRGCGLRVRLAAGWPVGIAGMLHHPVNRGALCPLAFGAHQLNWHPRRLRQPLHNGRPASWDDALAAFRKACAEGPVAIVDGWPRRAASAVLEHFSNRHGSSYRVILSTEQRALQPYANWSGVPPTALGYDLENTRTIVSFGAPLLDGWCAPGRFERLWTEHCAGQTDPDLRLIQVEPSLSRTAGCAWKWIKILPGSESFLAAGLARVLLEEQLVAARGPMPPATLAEAGTQTGLSPESIRGLARTIAAQGPALAIAADAAPAIAALNIVLGAVGARGGIIRQSFSPARANGREPGKIRAVLIDSTVPWDFTSDASAEVFHFAAWDGGGNRAGWLLPAPGFLEELTDIPTAPASARETYAVAAGLLKPVTGARCAAEFLASVDSRLMPVGEIIHARCRELFRSQTGHLVSDDVVPVSKFASSKKIEAALCSGAVWIGGPPRPGGFHCRLNEWPAPSEPPHAAGWTAAWVPPVLPPLAPKLYQESSLRERPAKGEI
jgi:anaerobic selenocysteine-containing dehydrogenase